MKLSTTTLGCLKWDLATTLQMVSGYGYEGIDFRGIDGELNIWTTPEFSTHLTDTAKKIQDAGLETSCISSSIHFVDAGAEQVAAFNEELIETAKICKELNCTQVRIFGGDLHRFADGADESDRERIIDHAVERCSELARMANEIAEVDLLIETHDAWTASEHMRTILERVNNPHVACVWDIKHTWWLGKEVAETTWSILKPWIRNTHWKDVRRYRGDDETIAQHASWAGLLVPMGAGIMPAADAFDLLANDGYDGWYTLEWEKKWHPHIAEAEVAFPGFVSYMRGLAEHCSPDADDL